MRKRIIEGYVQDDKIREFMIVESRFINITSFLEGIQLAEERKYSYFGPATMIHAMNILVDETSSGDDVDGDGVRFMQ